MRPGAVDNLLKEARIPYTTFQHRPAYSAQDEAAVSHVPGRSWAKSVAFFADDEPIVAVVPAPCQVDPERLRTAAGAKAVRLVPQEVLPTLYPHCEPGAVPPFGYTQRVFVDRSLVGDPEMVLGAGTHIDAIRMHYADWAEIVHPVIGTFTNSQIRHRC
jgi:Ala-tRNA(Pro) deacylase